MAQKRDVFARAVFFNELKAFFGADRGSRGDHFLKTTGRITFVSADHKGFGAIGDLHHRGASGVTADGDDLYPRTEVQTFLKQYQRGTFGNILFALFEHLTTH